MEEIFVDEQGYIQFFEELEKLKQISLFNASTGSEAYNDAVGDGWHDNFAFEETMRESRTIAKKIDKMLQTKNYLKVVSTDQYYSDSINIGDVLRLEIKYGLEDSEIMIVKLTGKYLPSTNSEIQEVTLNSPIGKAIYMKKLDDRNIHYMVNDNKIEIKVIDKLDLISGRKQKK